LEDWWFGNTNQLIKTKMSKTKNTPEFQKMMDEQDLAASFHYEEEQKERELLFRELGENHKGLSPKEIKDRVSMLKHLKEMENKRPEIGKLFIKMVYQVMIPPPLERYKKAKLILDELAIKLKNYEEK
jgi:hypothetical protein